MKDTKIEWCDSTFNPWIGCTKVGPGCDHCYAEKRDARFVRKGDPARGTAPHWGRGAPRHRTNPSTWAQPMRWQQEAAMFFAEHGRRRRVFCASLADVFDNEVDAQWRDDLWRLILATPDLDWLLVTKRISNVAGRTPIMGMPPNVWLGVTVVNQKEADRDVPRLLATPAAVRFLSIEPLLGPITLGSFLWEGRADCVEAQIDHLDWIIVGGESGDEARRVNPFDVRSLRDQAAAAGTPFFFKQWGEWGPVPKGEALREGDCLVMDSAEFIRAGVAMRKMGKKKSGRELDGREHNDFPAGARA